MRIKNFVLFNVAIMFVCSCNNNSDVIEKTSEGTIPLNFTATVGEMQASRVGTQDDVTSNINTTDIATTIRYPYCYNTSNTNGSLGLWCVGNTVTTINTNPVIKSIYDPSLVGYHLPCTGAF